MSAAESAVGGSQGAQRGAEFTELVRLFAEAGRDGSLRFVIRDFERIRKTGESVTASIERLSRLAQRVDAFGHQLIHALDGGESSFDRV